jgi:3-hydroxybutyryl-CoA dehydrogenase
MGSAVNRVLIYGYGVMGRGVARTFAQAGFETIVKSRRASSLADLPANVRAVDELPEEAPDLIIEFVPEDVATKRAVYSEIEATYSGDQVLVASGTSGLDLVKLSAKMRNPERFVGIHYFMPADTTPVVEVMAGPATPRAVVDRAADALERTGKETVVLYKPIVGFLINRLQHALLHEAYYLIEAGVASAADIDRAAARMLAPRMCLNGLIQQKDISGLKIHADAQRSIVPKLFHNGAPNPMVQTMVQRGEEGLSAGRGFYDWSGCDKDLVRSLASSRLALLLGFLDRDVEPLPEAARPKPIARGGGRP